MQRPSKSREKYEKSLQRSFIGVEDDSHKHSISNYSKLSQLQDKLKQFGGLQEMQQEFLKDLNLSNQRLDGIISLVKGVMKYDPKGKRVGVSPLKKITNKITDKNKSSRLIERVEKAIIQQNMATK